jgi:acyl transferase domain-containing protein/acyl carrier protein
MSAVAKPATLTALQRALLAIEDAEARLADKERAAREPIAVIGLGCRVPGGGHNAASFWRLMHDGIDAITPVPSDRWDHDAFYHPDPETPGHIATRGGGFLQSVDQFDPAFFNIAPREAEGIDPQQRLLLEVSWEALENAGQAPDRLQDSATGVYVGVGSSDYAYLQLKSGDTGLLDAHFTSGVAHSVFSGRLSYLLGLRGPSLTIDTACSSSLVAVHLACQGLRSAECRMAIAGGVNLILAPDLFVALSRSRMLASDGRCKTFDAAADGFARAEGCGVVILKRVSDAQADGDRILAVIRGSAVNQDGPSSSLTAPNGPAQEAVIRQALAFAGLVPRQVGFIEAHGTGTQLGDPLEVKAIGAVFGADRDRPLIIGSVKTNIGHLEAAAGVTGLIKLVLALQHKTIPAHLHFRTPSPHIPWSDLPLQVPRQAVVWAPIDGRRIGGVSSFGFSGTNAHIIVEEAATVAESNDAAPDRSCLFALSARDPKALVELAARHATALAQPHEGSLADVCHTANAGRAHFAHRATIVARTIDELRSGLAAFSLGEEAERVVTAHLTARDPPRIAFLFTGQGAQYSGMARGLYDSSPVFRATLDRCADALASHLDRPLLDVLFDDTGSALIDQTAYTQPALFSVEFALTELWRSWGVAPTALIGHSVGEYVAACVAGVFSVEDGLRLIALRGRLMQSLPADGAMAAVFAPEEVVARIIAPHAAQVSLAAINGASQTVISGRAAEIAIICQVLRDCDIKHHVLPVSHAFHSPLMEPILARFEQAAEGIRFAAPRVRLISNLTGRLVQAGEITRPSYWRRHVRAAVRFSDGLRTLADVRPDICIEIGPRPTLLSLASAALEAHPPKLIASLRHGRPDWEQMLEGLSALYLAGAEVDWRGFSQPGTRLIVDLPTYPFQRERCWFCTKPGNTTHASNRDNAHPLLGTRQRTAAAGAIYQSRISAGSPDYVRQHRVLDHVLLPATAYLEMLIAGACNELRTDHICIEDATIGEAMLLDDDGTARIVQTIFAPDRDGADAISISSIAEAAADSAPWTWHAGARIRVAERAPVSDGGLCLARERCASPIDVSELYRGFAALGVQFGGDFHSIREAWRGEAEALAKVVIDPARATSALPYKLHPILLDGCLQALAAAMPVEEGMRVLYLPIGVASCAFYGRAGNTCWSHVVVRTVTHSECRADIRVFSDEGTLVVELREVQLKRVSREALVRIGERWLGECLYEMVWRRAAPAGSRVDVTRSPGLRNWLLFADEGGVAAGIAARLEARGDRCTLVEAGQFAFQPGRACINPSAAEDYRRLIAELHAADDSVHGVVYAWALDGARPGANAEVQFADLQTCSAVAPTLLAQALISENVPPGMWLITRGGQHAAADQRTVSPWQASVWGLCRTLANEHPELACVCIDLDPAADGAELDALATVLIEEPTECQIALRSGERLVARLARMRRAEAVQADRAPEAATRLAPTVPGTFERFVRQPIERRAPAAGEVEIAVQATGLNFKDVLNVLGMLSAGPILLGGECAGQVTRVGHGVIHLRPGDRVVAVAPDCFASSVIAKSELVQRWPDEMSVEEAAAFPIAFITASFCLSHTAGMRKGDRVLIHAATGGVGMAALQLAQRAGAEVFATAGSEWKRDLLRSLGVRHVFDSRTSNFVNEIMTETSGHGVDIVLNSLAGELLEASFAVLAFGGRFVEIGKRGIKPPDWVANLGRDLRYFVVDWSTVAMTDPAQIGGLMRRLVEQARRGDLTPLPRQVFALEDTPQAFRLLAQARHVGKVVVRHGHATPVSIRTDGTYLVTGGLSGLGLLVARWLAARGAGRVVLIGRRGATPEVSMTLDELRASGTSVVAEAVDVTDETALLRLLSCVRADGPPLRGIVHCAVVLDDAGLPQQTESRFANVFAPKVRGALLLDKLTRADPLDLFVTFSSIAAVLGAPGQANYAAANAILDLLAHERRHRGLRALSINWGAWAEVGAAADRGLTEQLAARGVGALTPAQGISALERLLQDDTAQAIVAPMDWQRFKERLGPRWMRTLLADLFENAAYAPRAAESVAPQMRGLLEEFATAPAPRRRQLAAKFVRDLTLRTLGIDPRKDVDSTTPLSELGLDSLLAVELRNALGSTLRRPLAVTLLFDYPTIESLTEYLLDDVLAAELTAPADVAAAAAAAPPADRDTNSLDIIEALSDDEVDRLLAARERLEA